MSRLLLLVVVYSKVDQGHRGDSAQAERAGLAAGLDTVPQVNALAMVSMRAGEQLQCPPGLIGLQADGTVGVAGSTPHHAGGRAWPLLLAPLLALPPALVALHASCEELDGGCHGDQDAGGPAQGQDQTVVKEVYIVGKAPAGMVAEAPCNGIPEAALIQEDDGPLLSLAGLPPKPRVHLHDEGHHGRSLHLPVPWCHVPNAR